MKRADTLNWHNYGSVLEHLFYGRERIKTHYQAQNFIRELFRERGQIKTKHRQRNFIAELSQGRGRSMFNGGRQTIMHY